MKKALFIGTAAVLLLGGWYFFGNKGASNEEQNFTIETAEVERGDVARLVSASGAVRALTTVEVGSQVSGQIMELMADFNSAVTENQIIARIDPQTFETRVASASADIESAEANLEVQGASISRAEANLENFKKDYVRQKALFEQDAVSLSLLEDTERQLAVAEADLLVAKAQMKTSKATLSQRKATLESAKVDLERSIIRSPIDGVVIERNVDVGQTVAASFSAPVLFSIAQDLGDIRIDAAVVEADIGGINAGDPATFKVDAYPEETFNGVVEQVRLSAETLSNVVTYTVVIAARNPTGRLLPGMTANVEIEAEKRQDVLRLAEVATRFRPPLNGPEVLESERGGQRGGQGGRGGDRNQLGDLDIAADRKADIEAKLQAELATLRDSLGDTGGGNFGGGGMGGGDGGGMGGGDDGGGGDQNGARQRLQLGIERILRENLTPEEFKTYQSQQATATQQRRVDLYQTAEGEALQTQGVFIGLSDGSFVEVLRGAEEGDEFITRLRIASPE